MKTLFRIVLVLGISLLLLIAVGVFILTRPGVQKQIVEGQLPPGSTIGLIQVSPGGIRVESLDLQLEDGTRASLDRLETEFSLSAAIFDRTIRMRGLAVEGFELVLPPVDPASAAEEAAASDREEAVPLEPRSDDAVVADAASELDPSALLNQLGTLEWLFDIDAVRLDGRVLDGLGNRYIIDFTSSPLAPGLASSLAVDLQLDPGAELQSLLQQFSSEIRLELTQKEQGGFTRIGLNSTTEGFAAGGERLLSMAQTLSLELGEDGESASVDISFDADFPRPAAFAPGLAALRGSSLQGQLSGRADGPSLSLEKAQATLSAGGAEIAAIDLKQPFTVGGSAAPNGELIELALRGLPLEWLNPAIGQGVELRGAPIRAAFILEGDGTGGLSAKGRGPLELGPLSIFQGGRLLVDSLALRLDPRVELLAGGSWSYDSGDLELRDTYGPFLSGRISGDLAEAEPNALFGGLRMVADLELGLAELMQQPALSGMASIMDGRARVQFRLDETTEAPLQLQTAISGLRARELPGQRQDYQLAAQLVPGDNDTFAVGLNLRAGSEARPTTAMQLSAQARAGVEPVPFQVNLEAEQITQRDFDLLIAAAQPRATTPARPTEPSSGASRGGQEGIRDAQAPDDGMSSGAPAWALADGSIGLSVQRLLLNSGQAVEGLRAQLTVSEPRLELTELSARLGQARLSGRGRVLYDPRQAVPYSLGSELSFSDLNPVVFAAGPSASVPVEGLFDGELMIAGEGQTLERALDEARLELSITGREGVLTAFDLDQRSQLGLLGAGILGQSLNRPGITAMAQAIPYFNNMRFDDFALNINRGADGQVRIPELRFVGDNLRIKGTGLIAARRFSEILNQPLDLSLELGARGRLVDYLEVLDLLGPATSEDGFRAWKQTIDIGGTLGDPDTEALKRLLNDAARSALSRPESRGDGSDPQTGDEANPQSTPNTEPAPRREQPRDEIDIGIDLLNSVLG
jgi:hypothetical protein